MRVRPLKERDRIIGRITKKSIDLYLAKRPVIITYGIKGKVNRKYYKRKDLARDLGITTKAMRNWELTGRVNKFMKIRLSILRIVPMRIWHTIWSAK